MNRVTIIIVYEQIFTETIFRRTELCLFLFIIVIESGVAGHTQIRYPTARLHQ